MLIFFFLAAGYVNKLTNKLGWISFSRLFPLINYLLRLEQKGKLVRQFGLSGNELCSMEFQYHASGLHNPKYKICAHAIV